MTAVSEWIANIERDRKWWPGKPATIEELVVKYIRSLERQARELNKQAVADSWERNPDRMGGSFTQQEIEDARRGGPGGWY